MSKEKVTIIVIGEPNAIAMQEIAKIPECNFVFVAQNSTKIEDSCRSKFSEMMMNEFGQFYNSKITELKVLKDNGVYSYDDLIQEYNLILKLKSKLPSRVRQIVKLFYEKVHKD